MCRQFVLSLFHPWIGNDRRKESNLASTEQQRRPAAGEKRSLPPRSVGRFSPATSYKEKPLKVQRDKYTTASESYFIPQSIYRFDRQLHLPTILRYLSSGTVGS